ncbi:hypothetical protein D5039_05030 [Verminephrobacter aporrectodeae subsp. tuberculatae]|uniref:Uncharacterized protein n=1 Tax=Verminephrobacter aporrectodeae subsp. tuberculatae TaxID=1110392 RepID=A0ABT3KQH6_9BURK|nr:hypothetical protein [Verminephrobacter aporrectodeae]MCW5320568.1 hypothetical protein [Verminephrobacter aporrectodeae subsp. tuberculatae]
MKNYSPKFRTEVPVMDRRGNVWEACGETIWPVKMHDPCVTDNRATLDVYVHRDMSHTKTPTLRLHGNSGSFAMNFNLGSEDAMELAANLLAGVDRVRAIEAIDGRRSDAATATAQA